MSQSFEEQPTVRLAMCSAGELFGGVERHLLGMCTWLLRQGMQPCLILFNDAELARQARAMGVSPIIIETGSALDLRGPRQVARRLAELEINVVHAHGYKAVVNCALARRHYFFALVRTVHGLVESGDGMGLGWLKPRAYAWLERTLGRQAEATVTYVTEDLRRRHANHDRGLLTRTVYNGIDPLQRADYQRPPDLAAGKFHAAAVGRISEVKGLAYLVKAMGALDPAREVVLNIIGTGPLEDELQALVSSLDLGTRVRFLGFKEDVYAYLAHIDVLVMPSLHEGLPYTLLEALSLNLPIIASDVGGLGEVLAPSDRCFLVEPGDVAGLTTALAEIHETHRNYRCESAGMKFAFNLEQMGAAFFQLYEHELVRWG